MGARIRAVNRHTVDIDCSMVHSVTAPPELMRKIRASYYLIGALLGRFGRACVGMPGGCDLGVRPIDQHIKGFVAMGAEVDIRNGVIDAEARSGRLQGAPVYLDMISVGATINIMIAASLAEGLTIIDNAAKEPHVWDLANFLNSMEPISRRRHRDVIQDTRRQRDEKAASTPSSRIRIEAGTYIAAAAAAGGDVIIRNVIPSIWIPYL